MRAFLYFLIRMLFDLAEIVLFIRVFISWLPVPQDHRLVVLLYRVTEPVLAPIRSMLQRFYYNSMMFDFSPLIAFLLLGVVRYIVLVLLF